MKISLKGCVRLPDCDDRVRKTSDVDPDQRLRDEEVRAVTANDRARTAAFVAPVGLPAHSGHLIPTDAKTMHSGQIGRPQFEHVMAVSFDGCR